MPDQVGHERLTVGPGTYGGMRCLFDNQLTTKVIVGAYCSFAEDVLVMPGGEHRPDWVTTYPFSDLWPEGHGIKGHPASSGDIVIGNDVWVGTGTLILSGTTIGDGAVIGARSVVKGYVPPYAIFGGVPARYIRNRFSDPVSARLLKIKWWDWPRERIAKALPLLLQSDPSKFIAAFDAGEI